MVPFAPVSNRWQWRRVGAEVFLVVVLCHIFPVNLPVYRTGNKYKSRPGREAHTDTISRAIMHVYDGHFHHTKTISIPKIPDEIVVGDRGCGVRWRDGRKAGVSPSPHYPVVPRTVG